MGTLNFSFDGICTHFTNTPENPIPVPYRVVVINATEGATIAGLTIPPHFPTVSIDTPNGTSIGPLPLTGITIAVTNAVGPAPELPPALPILSFLMSNLQPLSPFSQGTVIDQAAQSSACYVDLTSGSMTTQHNDFGSIEALAFVTTDGEPTVSFTPFGLGGTLPPPLQTSMELPSGSTVAITNQSSRQNEAVPSTRSHFLLHYLTASELPTVPQLPPPSPTASKFPILTVGGGCSNSGYP